MADCEQVQRESPSQQTADYSVRYSVRNLLTAMTVVAVVFAVTSPWLRGLSSAALLNLVALWGIALLVGIPTGIGQFRAYRKFLADYANALYLVNNAKLGTWKRHLWQVIALVAVAAFSSFYAVRLASSSSGGSSQSLLFGFLPVSAGYGFQLGQLGANSVMTLAGYRLPLALVEKGIVGLSGATIPWAYIRGIRETKRPNTFDLRRYDGDLRLTVQPAERKAFLALVEEKTGHRLGLAQNASTSTD